MYKSLKIPVLLIKDNPTIGRFTLNFPYEIVIITSPGFLNFRLTLTLSGSSVLSRDDVGVCRHVATVH